VDNAFADFLTIFEESSTLHNWLSSKLESGGVRLVKSHCHCKSTLHTLHWQLLHKLMLSRHLPPPTGAFSDCFWMKGNPLHVSKDVVHYPLNLDQSLVPGKRECPMRTDSTTSEQLHPWAMKKHWFPFPRKYIFYKTILTKSAFEAHISSFLILHTISMRLFWLWHQSHSGNKIWLCWILIQWRTVLYQIHVMACNNSLSKIRNTFK
jgi:hypothetical protein